LLAFNIDPSFGNVLDGLIMVDLSATDPKILKRYIEPDGYSSFMSYHRQPAAGFFPVADIPANVCPDLL
jgi:hypothetical protein